MTHPTLQCQACKRSFEAQLPMGPRAFARSRLMFLVERCTFCHDSRAYLRTDYRFESTRQLLAV